MFLDNKQQGLENPIHLSIEQDKVKFLSELDLIFSVFGLTLFFLLTIISGIYTHTATIIISFFFGVDYAYRFMLAENKKKYLRTTWINLFLCIPMYSLPWMVVALTIRMLKSILEYTLNKVKTAFTSMFIIGICLVTFSTISILQFETLASCNIKTAWDAIWWSLCTITTVGYGDKYPVTDGGKIVATMLMISGIGLFGTLIGYISTFFTDKEKKNNDKIDTIEELSHQIAELSKTITELKQKK